MRPRYAFRVLLLLTSAACSSRAAPAADTARAAPVVATGVASAPVVPVKQDSAEYVLLVSVGPREAAAPPPGLLAEAPDGRRIGFRATGPVAEWPRATYDSSRTMADDDRDASDAAPAIDQRELRLPVTMTESYTLTLTGVARGRFDVMVNLTRNGRAPFPGAARSDIALDSGAVRKFRIEVAPRGASIIDLP